MAPDQGAPGQLVVRAARLHQHCVADDQILGWPRVARPRHTPATVLFWTCGRYDRDLVGTGLKPVVTAATATSSFEYFVPSEAVEYIALAAGTAAAGLHRRGSFMGDELGSSTNAATAELRSTTSLGRPRTARPRVRRPGAARRRHTTAPAAHVPGQPSAPTHGGRRDCRRAVAGRSPAERGKDPAVACRAAPAVARPTGRSDRDGRRWLPPLHRPRRG